MERQKFDRETILWAWDNEHNLKYWGAEDDRHGQYIVGLDIENAESFRVTFEDGHETCCPASSLEVVSTATTRKEEASEF